MSLVATTDDLKPSRAKPPRRSDGPGSGSGPSFSGTLALIGWLCLIAIVPLVIVGADHRSGVSPDLIAVWAVIAVSSTAITHTVALGEPRLMRLGFWVFVYLFLGIAPLAQATTDQWPLAGEPSVGEMNVAGLISLVGILAWVVGYRLTPRPAQISAPQLSQKDGLRRKRFVLVACLASTLYIAVVGPAAFFTNRLEFTATITERIGDPALGTMLVAIGEIPICIAFFVLIDERRRGFQVSPTVFVWVVALMLTVNSIFISSRTWTGVLLLSAIAALGRHALTPRRVRMLAAVWLVGAMVLMPAANLFRTADRGDIAAASPRESVVTGDYDAFQQMAHGVQYVDEHGIRYGAQAIGSALFFVPRSMWPDKPEATGVMLGREAGAEFLNLSAPLWIEGFVDFGFPGAVLIMLCWGSFCARMDNRLGGDLRNRAGPYLVVVPFLAFWQIVILRGSLMALLPSMIILVLCLRYLVGRRQGDRVLERVA